MNKATIPAFDMEEAFQGLREGKDLTGKDGILTPLIKQLTEAALQGDLESHLADKALPQVSGQALNRTGFRTGTERGAALNRTGFRTGTERGAAGTERGTALLEDNDPELAEAFCEIVDEACALLQAGLVAAVLLSGRP